MGRSAMLARLNAETREHHAQADSPWLALLAADVRRQNYIRQLVVTYGFEAPVESALAQDLLGLGYTPLQLTELPQCFSIMSFDDIAEALGWLDVVERATLHHDPVRRNIRQRIPAARHATSYLAASGSLAGTRWQALGIVLDKHAATPAIGARIVTAAEHAFRRLRDWIETNQTELRSTG